MSGSSADRAALDLLAGEVRADRRAGLHALHVLEYALAAPAPRRQRTWLHRVTVSVDALHTVLEAQAPKGDGPIGLLDEIALCHPDHLPAIEALQQDVMDLTIAVASLREQIEPEPTIEIDPAEIRDRLGTLTRRFREYQAREVDLVYEVTGLELQEF